MLKKFKTKGVLLLFAFSVLLFACCNTNSQNNTQKLLCTFEISCKDALEAGIITNDEITELLPSDGIIYYSENVEFSDGQSVFDILLNISKNQKIPFEFVKSTYTGVYIEGIANLYEFDGGSNYGWLYSVNGEYPSLSCSSYFPKDKDVITFEYNRSNSQQINSK